MRVFITGGTGFIGSAIIRELLAAGHTVTGLARTPEAAAKLAAAGATPRLGELTDLAALRAAAAEADAVIHTAFIHDFSAYAEACKTDLHAVEALIDGLAAEGATGKVFVNTSGTLVLPVGRIGTEDDAADEGSLAAPRVPSERAALAAARRGVRSAVIRLPPSVHGPGDHGFVPVLIDLARRTGISAYLGSGDNRWPAVHRDDAAVLYRLAVERLADGSLPAGSVLHGVADSGVPLRDLAGAIAERLGLGPPVASEAEAAGHFGWLAMVLGADNPTSSAITQRLTGWKPTAPGLLDDVRGPAYKPADTEH